MVCYFGCMLADLANLPERFLKESRLHMPSYRVLHIAEDGAINSFEEIECEEDAAATLAAKKRVDGFSVELWASTRKVAAFTSAGDPIQITSYAPAAIPDNP